MKAACPPGHAGSASPEAASATAPVAVEPPSAAQEAQRSVQRALAGGSMTLSPSAVLGLQATHGNRFVVGLLGQARRGGRRVQAKLIVTQAAHAPEQQADRLAREISARAEQPAGVARGEGVTRLAPGAIARRAIAMHGVPVGPA